MIEWLKNKELGRIWAAKNVDGARTLIWSDGRSGVRLVAEELNMVIFSEERPQFWLDKWILNHENAPVHDTLRFQEFLAKKSITKQEHQPYSPDLAPAILKF
jgi:hypothetical protein